MRPRLLFDASTVTAQADGLSNYIIALLNHFPEAAFEEFAITVLTHPDTRREEFAEVIARRGIATLPVRIAPIGPRRDWDFARFWWRAKHDFDLFHSTSAAHPMAVRGAVATIHDVTFNRMFDADRNPLGLAVGYMKLITAAAIRNAAEVIAVSRHTRAEVIELYRPAHPEKIRVIHHGWEHIRRSEAGRSAGAGRFLFSLGSFRGHKNIPAMIEGFELALPQLPADVTLVISGVADKLAPRLAERLARINAGGERVRFTGYLDDDDVTATMRAADAFVLPSLYEGFGMSALEAFACDTPLLYAAASSLPEVVGEAGLPFDPRSIQSIADAIVRFYREPQLGEELVRLGRDRLGAFSWAEAANATLQTYRDALAQRKG